MEAKEKVILRDILYGMKLQFCVPVFQRNYSWSEKNCARLFDDICELASNNTKRHFIGSFVYKTENFKNTQYIQFVLVDGQQRLTSLTLILKSLYDYLEEFGEEYKNIREEIESYLYNKFTDDKNLKLKLKPNKEDDKNFNLLMNNNFEEIEKSSLIYQNYKYFLERIQKFKDSIEKFYDALQRLEGVAIVLGENDNAQMIFESLNSTGLDLTDVDLIRNYLLMNHTTSEQEDLYTKYWLKLESKLGKNFIDFVRDYLSLKNGTVTQKGKNKIYIEFRKYYTINFIDREIYVEDFLKEWMEYADAYVMLLNLNSNLKNKKRNDLEMALDDIINLDIKTTFPFLLGVLHDYRKELLQYDDVVKIIRLIESYVVRRSICSMQGGALSQFIASLYNELKEKYKDEFYENCCYKVATKLVSITTNARFPQDAKFKEEFINRDMYISPLKKYILGKLENSFQHKEIVNLDNLTIEHVMPYILTEQWKEYLNMENVDEFHEQYKNRIGNLTLTAYNQEMGQKLYDEKKNNIDFSRLCLNKYFDNIPKWNKAQIEIRGERLFEIALKLWPFPNANPEKDLSIESYNILDDSEEMDFTNTKPIKFVFNEEPAICVASWTELFQLILKQLYKINSELFISILEKDNYCNKPILSKNKEELRNFSEFEDFYYIETNFNTMKKISILKKLISDMGIEESTLIVYIISD